MPDYFAQVCTLEELAGEAAKIHLDSCILNRDYNYREILRSTVGDNAKNPFRVNEIASRLGSVSRFREVKYSALKRQAEHAAHLQQIITAYSQVKSVPEIVEEYYPFVEHLKTSLGFLKKNSRPGPAGSKEILLRKILETHTSIFQLLDERSALSEDGKMVAGALRKYRMHLPSNGKYTKKRGIGKETSEGDAALVAEAIMDASHLENKIAIITSDADVLNLVRNFTNGYHQNKLPPELSSVKLAGAVTVYTPSLDNWKPGLEVWFKGDTRNYWR